VRKLGSLGLAGAVMAGIVFSGAGAAYADTTDCITTTGVRVCWNETTHVLSIYDILADGDTAYATAYDGSYNQWDSWHTTGGAGTHITVNLSNLAGYYDVGNAIWLKAQRVNNSGVVNGTDPQILAW
jgi:hypothetical protein